MTQAEMRASPGLWVELLGKRWSLSTESLMPAEASMGKAAGECSQPGTELSQEAGRRGEEPFPDTILGALGSSCA